LASAFLETVFLEVAGAEAFIILGAVEVFMAGIRIERGVTKSIFGPLFIFAGEKIFCSNSSHYDSLF